MTIQQIIFYIYLLFLVSGCGFVQPTKTESEDILQATTKELSEETKLSHNHQLLDSQKVYSKHDSIKFTFHPDMTVVIYERNKNGKVEEKYKASKLGEMLIATNTIGTDVDWLIIKSFDEKKLLELRPEQIDSIFSDIPFPEEHPEIVSPFSWTIYERNGNDIWKSKTQKIATIQVQQYPFSLAISDVKTGKHIVGGSDSANSGELKLSLVPTQSAYFALFLDYPSKDGIKEIVQVFPNNEKTKYLEQNKVEVFSYTISNSLQSKNLYCFYLDEEERCNDLARWLKSNAKGAVGIGDAEDYYTSVTSENVEIVASKKDYPYVKIVLEK